MQCLLPGCRAEHVTVTEDWVWSSVDKIPMLPPPPSDLKGLNGGWSTGSRLAAVAPKAIVSNVNRIEGGIYLQRRLRSRVMLLMPLL